MRENYVDRNGPYGLLSVLTTALCAEAQVELNHRLSLEK